MRILLEQLKRLSFKDWLIIVMGFLLLGTFLAYKHYMKLANERIVVSNDSLTIYKNKLDSEYVAKNVYIQTTK